jgi:cold shock CspA family protein
MNTKLVLIGQVYSIARKQFEEQETVYAQFLNKQENGGVEIQQVKITDIADIQSLKEGQNVKIPIKVSSFQNKLYFTQIEPIVK